MQEELKEQAKELYVSLKENEADIRREIERVDTFCDPDLRWQEIAGMEMPPAEETQNALKEIIRAGRAPVRTGERRKAASGTGGDAPDPDREEAGDEPTPGSSGRGKAGAGRTGSGETEY